MEKNEKLFSVLSNKIKVMIGGPGTCQEKMQGVCDLMKNGLPGYDWVGFYLVDKERPRELILGPFSGEPTEHTRIPFGKGICGQAAATEKTFVIDDVAAEDNYLSCNLNVKSEIVVPIFKNGIIIGELDIDSHRKAAFDESDKAFLEKTCELIADITEERH
jgi:GAF domain-containing protein